MISTKISNFFSELEKIWESFPSYFKVFLYSTVSTTFGAWVAGELSLTLVLLVVATNLGIYSGPRAMSTQIQAYDKRKNE